MVPEVQEALAIDAPLAYSTVAMVCPRIKRKGLISHHAVYRPYVYHLLISNDATVQSNIGDLVDQISEGNPTERIHHLLESDQVDRRERNRIMQFVNEHAAHVKRKP